MHTPGTWTLGDAQELADGLLPETYHPDTGEWVARHWFAWPAATLGALHLGGFHPAGGP